MSETGFISTIHRFREHEKWVASQVKPGQNVKVTVSFKYKGNSTRPSQIIYKTTANGKTTTKTFKN